MMEVLLRSFNPWVSGKGGQPLDKPRWSGEYWAKFEKLLMTELMSDSHNVHIQAENVNKGDKLSKVDLAIYAHRNLFDIANKTVYSYPEYAEANKRLFYMMMHMPGWFQLDSNGWGAQHSSYKSPPDLSVIDERAATLFCDNLRNNIIANNISKIDQPVQSDIGADGYLLILTQLENDYTIRYQSPISIPQFIGGIAAWAKANAIKVIIKRHPLDQSIDVHNAILAAENHLFIRSTANIHSLIKGSRAVYVINSGSGFESLIHNKPVVTFGKCDYKNATFAGNMLNLSEAWAWVNSFDVSCSIMLKKFVYWYYSTNIYDTNSEDCGPKIRKKLAEVCSL